MNNVKTNTEFALIFDSYDSPFKVYLSQSFNKIKDKLFESILNQLEIDKYNDENIDENLIQSFEKYFKKIKNFEDLKILEDLATDNFAIYYEKNYFNFIDNDLNVKIILTTNIERI